jgi:hypothetical protein
VFEWNSSKFKTKGNPGVGPSLGIIKDAEVGKKLQLEVLWSDTNELEVMDRSGCRLTCDIGESFKKTGRSYRLKALDRKGVLATVKVVKVTARKTQKRTQKASAKPKKKKKQNAASSDKNEASSDTDADAATPTKRKADISTRGSCWRKRKTPERRKDHPRKKFVRGHNSGEDTPLEDLSQEDSAQEDSAAAAWSKCRASKLDVGVGKLLEGAQLKMSSEDGYGDDPLLFPFIHRIAKEYASLHRKMGNSIHLHREDFAVSAIKTVYKQIPANSRRPFDGDDGDAYTLVFPILEEVFSMPHAGLKVGSPQWIQHHVAHPKAIPYSVSACFSKLLKASVKYAMLSEDPLTGRPVLHEDEVVPAPDSEYNPEKSPNRVVMSRSVENHGTFPFFRVHSHLPAIRAIRNLNLYPQMIKAKDMPTGVAWDNVSESLHTYHHKYCAAEGLSKTSKMARLILLYLFYGRCRLKSGKLVPVIRGIHKKASEGRHRCDTVDFIVDTVDCIIDTVDFIVDTVDFIVDTVRFIVDTVDFIVDTVEFYH